ncbi:hypothetical protein HY797_01610 [Candidatus Falkowbacteria bacterium]|nr:hypothetical protein [Candidatus Falkowbacteria bacterium]
MWIHENFGIYKSEGKQKEEKEDVIDSKRVMVKIAWKIRPDLGGENIDINSTHHQLSTRLTAAYEKAQHGHAQELINLHNDIFPGEDIYTVNVEQVVNPEFDAFLKEFEAREEIFQIIKSDVEQLLKAAKKTNQKAIFRHAGLKQKWEQLCNEKGLKYDSDYAGVRDREYITQYLYHVTRTNK